MVGAKTVTSILLLVVASILGWSIGSSPARLATLGPIETFWTAFFAFVTGSTVYGYWGLNRPSARCFRYSADEWEWADESHFVETPKGRILIGENLGDAFDFGPRVQYVVYVALAFWIGVITLDARAVDLLGGLPGRVTSLGSDFCPEPGSEGPAEVETDPGCALIRRAYALGYAETLGPCEAKEEQEDLEPCTRRQRDEPFLHYAWRRLDRFFTTAIGRVHKDRLKETRTAFELHLEHLEELVVARASVLDGAPRASHHVFTNLPDPGGWWAALVGDGLRRQGCADRNQQLPHRLRDDDDGLETASRGLELIIGHLLFTSRYAPAAGSCRELTIHWDAPPDACARVAESPTAFLSEFDAMEEVEDVLERYRVTIELQKLASTLSDASSDHSVRSTAGGMSTLAGILHEVSPRRFISFQCYVVEPRAETSTSSRTLILGGHSFIANEVRAPAEAVDTDRYHQIASMLAPDFHYNSLLSDATPGDPLGAGIDGRYFDGRDGFLSRLDYLNETDILLGHDWLQQREDLLDVYPYHVHLKNYVRLFRARYRAERGRL